MDWKTKKSKKIEKNVWNWEEEYFCLQAFHFGALTEEQRNAAEVQNDKVKSVSSSQRWLTYKMKAKRTREYKEMCICENI